MAVLQVNALFKKAAPAPAKTTKKAPAKKAAPAPKKAAPAPKKVAPKKTVVKKVAPVRKSGASPNQAGSDLSKWYGEFTFTLQRRGPVLSSLGADGRPTRNRHEITPRAQ